TRRSSDLFLAVAAITALSTATRMAHGDCAFPFTPTTYEDLKSRHLYTAAIDLAANNMLFPGDPYFGLPDLEFGPRTARQKAPGKIPPPLLKAVSVIRSGITQGAAPLPFRAR